MGRSDGRSMGRSDGRPMGTCTAVDQMIDPCYSPWVDQMVLNLVDLPIAIND
eukprot:SAG31_NODE_19579_length_598_cov_0.661323_1_plen_52_part_10